MKQTVEASAAAIDFAGGHVALNFINTLRQVAQVIADTLQSDQDVIVWMRKMGLAVPKLECQLRDGELLRDARRLRELGLAAIKQRKGGKALPVSALNEYLAEVRSRLELRKHEGEYVLHRAYFAQNAKQFLAPVSECVGDLLVNGNFELIRQCEGSGCVLWFADRSSGRPRRFCIEETCGTRTRVAAFRARRAQAQSS